MATMTIRVCDTCKATDDVESYEIKAGEKRARLDLCGEHGKPLVEILASAPATNGTAPSVRAAVDPEKAAKRKAARERRAAEKAAAGETPSA